MQTQDYITTKEAATLASLTPRRIRQLLHEGCIPHVATILGRLIPRDAFLRYIAERQARAAVSSRIQTTKGAGQ